MELNNLENERIEKIEEILMRELNLSEVLPIDELRDFFSKFLPYIQHARSKSDVVAGRTPETLERDLVNYIEFCRKIDLSDKEIIISIQNFPAIIREANEKLEDKYILLSVLEDEDNLVRRKYLVNRPEDFIVDIKVIYARFMLMKQLSYPISWNSLVKASQNDFAKTFVKSKHKKPHKIFDDVSQVSSDKLKEMYPIDYEFINSLREMDVNSMFKESGKSYE